MEDLQGILRRHEFSFKKRFGQNFISDANLLRAIADAAELDEKSVVLEIGCGAGTLTRELSKQAGRVIAYEIDRSLKDVLAETLRGCENTEVRFSDFERVDLAALEAEIGEYTVAANLPYYITSPLILRFLKEGTRVKRLVVMVQEEVALRLCAAENTPDYGAITATLALRASAKIVRRVPKELFIPRPKVDSAVVRIDFEEGRLPVKDREAYNEVVRCAFLNRRKTLENNMVNYFHLSREETKEILFAAGVAEGVRGETLSPAAFAALSDGVFDFKAKRK